MLISDEYRALNAQMHIDKPKWGAVGVANAEMVIHLCKRMGTKTFLDYGAGREKLRLALEPDGYKVTSYDPCVPGIDTPPAPHDLVVCFDVLEHVEPECVDAVIADLARVTRKMGLYSVAMVPAKRSLPDGTNPHRSLHPYEWWAEKFERHFEILNAKKQSDSFGVIVRPKA